MVEVQDLVRRFGNKTVLDGIDLQVAEGEILAVMGSSGGGKTTLLKCISGLIAPTSGSVTVAGVNVEKESEKARRAMGMVFQSAALFDYLNVEDNILFGVRRHMRIKEAECRSLTAESLKMVGLTGSEKLLPSELSGGMRKRVGVARALALKPKVMLYDEPTTGLDPITAYAVDALIADVRKEFGMTSIVVSHDVSSVYRVADRIAFLDRGKLVYVGDPSGFEKSKDGAIRELLDKARAVSF
jgi:phospholipid/cholesterol/gamma-HCH transport system ATP-binding protein